MYVYVCLCVCVYVCTMCTMSGMCACITRKRPVMTLQMFLRKSLTSRKAAPGCLFYFVPVLRLPMAKNVAFCVGVGSGYKKGLEGNRGGRINNKYK
ncbi:hypothetical protein F5B20DRAFT_290383 [Whalleya microplaca]|nr:hypothetical protein F5B20DRAFT_290383 [Whalleya microplaca]